MSFKYRPEIDGLRAIAVIAVVLYHAEFVIKGVNLFEGGFIGVDVFFVISGYLITSIILKEMSVGEFSFLRFYERRARRLLPALFTVMFVSVPFAWMYMLPKAMKEYAGSVFSSLAFGSNFWFWQQNSYWAEPSALKPFLHTWSLSVEEQFYVIFPIFLLALWKYAKGYITGIFALGFILSIEIADFGTRDHPNFTFYLLPARGWELLAGAILAKIELDKGRVNHPFLNSIMPSLGLFLISFAIVFFTGETKHPSFITLIPVLGTMLVIWFSTKGELVTDIMSSKIFVGIGLISYGLYLWHYMIFAFSKIKGSPASQYDKIEWIMLAFGLSVVTFYFIEQPFRKKLKAKTLLFSLILGVVLLSSWTWSIIKFNGYPNRLPKILAEAFQPQAWMELKDDEGKYCYGDYNKADFCHKYRPGNVKTAFLIGDSTIESISSQLTSQLLDYGFNVIPMNSSACYFAPGFYSTLNGSPRRISKEPCDIEYQERRVKKIRDYPRSTLIVGGLLDKYLKDGGLGFLDESGKSNIKDAYKSSIMHFLSKGYTVIQLAPFPSFSGNVSQIIKNKIDKIGTGSDLMVDKKKVQSITLSILSFPTKTFDNLTKEAFEMFNKIRHKNYFLLKPHLLFCDTIIENKCASNNGRGLFFVDSNHPTNLGADMITKMVMEKIKMIDENMQK